MKHLAALCVFAAVMLAQIGRPGPSRRSESAPAPQSERVKTSNTSGVLRQFSAKQMIIEADDHRIIWYRLGGDVRIDRENAQPGDHLAVTSTQDDEGMYTATVVEWISAGTPEDRAAAVRTWDLPSATSDADRVLMEASASRPDDTTIRAAREAAYAFIKTLPNFIARQTTTRYVMEGARGNWRALDVVSANLVYRNGEEEYTEIKIGNKPVNQSMEELGGLHTKGEFGSILGSLFNPESGTSFSRPSQVDMRGRKAYVYKFEIPRERSQWRISAPSELYYAGYGGAVWIESTGSRILRIEMQARNLPRAFPFDTVETNIEYDYIRLDSGKQFLLPTESEALNCIRGTSYCMKNTTLFRNYSKFESDSRVIFDDKQ